MLDNLLQEHSMNNDSGYCTGMSKWFMSQYNQFGRKGLEEARKLISKITTKQPNSDYSEFKSTIIELKREGLDGEFCYLDSVPKTTQDLQSKLDSFPPNTPFYVYPNDSHVFFGVKLVDGTMMVYDHASITLSQKTMPTSELIEKWLDFYQKDDNSFIFATNSTSLSPLKTSNLTPMILAQMNTTSLSKRNKEAIVNQMKAFRGDVDHARSDGATALIMAIQGGHIELAKDILAKTTDVDHARSDGSTALLLAIQDGYIELTKDILAKTTDVDHARSDGSTALLLAIQDGHIELAKDILAKTTDVDHARSDGATALLLAIQDGHIELAKDILAKTTDVDHAGPDGATALILAIGYNHKEIAQLLYEKGADPYKSDKRNAKPIDWPLMTKIMNSSEIVTPYIKT